jgi:hypothetical protein
MSYLSNPYLDNPYLDNEFSSYPSKEVIGILTSGNPDEFKVKQLEILFEKVPKTPLNLDLLACNKYLVTQLYYIFVSPYVNFVILIKHLDIDTYDKKLDNFKQNVNYFNTPNNPLQLIEIIIDKNKNFNKSELLIRELYNRYCTQEFNSLIFVFILTLYLNYRFDENLTFEKFYLKCIECVKYIIDNDDIKQIPDLFYINNKPIKQLLTNGFI